MKETEFVKKYGVDLVKRDVACLESGFITKADFMEHYGFEILDDLKRLVESHELVESLGGLEKAKELLMAIIGRDHKYAQKFEKPALEKAIADVEACQ